MLGVHERALRISCLMPLGMSSGRDQRLRRLKLVRAPQKAYLESIERVAARYGFHDFHRFVTEYWKFYGEMPPMPSLRAVSGQRESRARATGCGARAIGGSQLVLISVVHATFESRRTGVSNVGIWLFWLIGPRQLPPLLIAPISSYAQVMVRFERNPLAQLIDKWR